MKLEIRLEIGRPHGLTTKPPAYLLIFPVGDIIRSDVITTGLMAWFPNSAREQLWVYLAPFGFGLNMQFYTLLTYFPVCNITVL